MSSRGRGGKRNKRNNQRAPKFITSAEEMEKRDEQDAGAAAERKARRKAAGADTSSDEEEGDHEDLPEFKEMSVGEGGAAKEKPKKQQAQLGERGLKIKDLKNFGGAGQPKRELSRKEREALEEIRKEKEYRRRHERGETDEAKKDLGRLAEVKARRAATDKQKEAKKKAEEEAAALKLAESGRIADEEKKKKAEKKAKKEKEAKKKKKEKEKKEKEKKKAEKADDSMFEFDLSSDSEGESDDSDFEMIESRDIKKMNPAKCKDKLKELGLEIQGNKKELQDRLLKFYASKKK